MKCVCINEDNAHFYANRASDRMTEAEIRGLVDTYASFDSIAAIFFCVNLRRALFNSHAWEPIYHGYDPAGDEDQPFLAGLDSEDRVLRVGSQGRQLSHNVWLLQDRGIDHFSVWLDQCRRRGIEGWLTMRMNDVHHSDTLDHPWHSTFWRTRPDLWRVEHKCESWWDRAFDYGKPEVREHHFDLIRELFERYDFCGLELDWIRSIFHFAPGGEQAGAEILTELMRDVRVLASEWADRRGHPIKLSVRIPENPVTGQRLGMDAPRWIREGLVDQVVLSQWLSVIPFDPPIELWRDIIGDRPVMLALNISTSTMPFSAAWARKGTLDATPEILRGAAMAAHHKGVDRLYLFNYCYMESEEKERLREIVEEINSLEAMRDKSRRHLVVFEEIAAPGEAEHAVLPQRFDTLAGSDKYGPTITLCPYLGKLPPDPNAIAVLGFASDEESPAGAEDLEVRVNSVACPYSPDAELPREYPSLVNPRYGFAVPSGVLHDGRNTIECNSTSKKGSLVWGEIYFQA